MYEQNITLVCMWASPSTSPQINK